MKILLNIHCLFLFQSTQDAATLKRFLNYQGLNILWSWMVDVNEYPAQLRGDCKLDIIRALQGLPISTRNAVEDSKVIKVRFVA